MIEEERELGERLLTQRPLPAPMFRAELRRRIVEHRRPAGLWRLVGGFATAGGLCFVGVGASLLGG